ncbi:MAG: lipid biosynthesis B12-binding/radical SAM protein [Kiritimatiellae bacterium]|nr:lipid biosynthesis B12-binding/radical SAM protein [Kiritimatiellia bacterium]
MKILLISSNMAATPYPVYPLGMSMVAGALIKADHDVTLFDFLHHGASLDALAEAVRDVDPGLVGISIRNIDNVNLLNEQRYIDAVADIVAVIKKETDAKIVLGGSGFSIMPEIILQRLGADYGIVGEGERLMTDFANDAAQGRYPDQRCLRSKPQLSGTDIPSASYDSDMLKFYLQNGNMAGVQTKRGCTHRCIYCTYPVLEGSKIRLRRPSDVVDDIESLATTHEVGYIFFTDSVFNDDDGHFRDVVAEMKRRGINRPWTAFFKPAGLDDQIIALMKETGLNAAEIGSDAPCDTTLRKMGKGFLFQDIKHCNDMFGAHGIATAHYFMFGCPGETKETVLEGIENLKSLKNAAVFIFMGIRILPGTPLADIAVKDGIISAGQDLLESVYYLSPHIDKNWLEKTLTEGFAGIRHCIFPPDALDSTLGFLHKMGYSGSMFDLLSAPRKRRSSKK